MSENEKYVDSLANRFYDLRSKVGYFERKQAEQAETTGISYFESRRCHRPIKACKPKRRVPSPSPCAKYEAGKYSDSKLAEKLESCTLNERRDWSEHELEVFQRPLPLISAGEKNVLQVNQRVLEQLRKIDLPCVIVAIVGLYRTGKSYLMNRLADADKGFAIGDTIQSETKGIWVWCKRHPWIADTVLVLLDTEGLGDVSKGDPSHDNRIFTLATLLCSTLVYNMKGVFDQDAVNKLTFVSEMAKNIRFEGRSDENNSMLKCILPGFVLVLRDFSLKLEIKGKKITADEYLEISLKNDNTLGESFNKPRESIRKFFPSDKRKCFALPVPGDGEVLEKMDQLQFEALSKNFKDATLKFVDFIFNQEPKELMLSKPVTGSMLAVLIIHYVDAFRQGAVPDVSNAYKVVEEIENTKVKHAALAWFEEGLVDQKMPVPYKELEVHFQSVQWTVLEYVRDNAMSDTTHNVEKDVQSYMEIVWVKRKSENEQYIVKYCDNSLEALQSRCELIDGIQNQTYAVVGGHIQFKRDLEQVRKQYNSTLKNKGYEDRETVITWSSFLQTLTDAEMEITQVDNSLSEAEKNREKEENKQDMQRIVYDMEEQKKQLLQEQAETYKALQKKIEDERDKQNQEHQKKMTDVIQKLVDLLQMKEEEKERIKAEKQWRIDEQRRRDEKEREREEHWRQWQKDERERYETNNKQMLDFMQNIQKENKEKEFELNRLKEEKKKKEKERKSLGFFGKLAYDYK